MRRRSPLLSAACLLACGISAPAKAQESPPKGNDQAVGFLREVLTRGSSNFGAGATYSWMGVRRPQVRAVDVSGSCTIIISATPDDPLVIDFSRVSDVQLRSIESGGVRSHFVEVLGPVSLTRTGATFTSMHVEIDSEALSNRVKTAMIALRDGCDTARSTYGF